MVRRRTWRHRPRLIVGSVLTTLVLLLAVFVATRPDEPHGGPGTVAQVATDYPFGRDSVWRADVSDAPVDPNSRAMVAGLARDVDQHWGGVASFNVDQFTASWYTAEADQPGTDVHWDDCQDKGYTPDGILGDGGAFTAVPIPSGATPSPGGDGQLTIYSPPQDRLWEFWQAKQVDGVWQACWGGVMDDVSENPGVFPAGYGASASGLAMSAGTVWVDDVRRGSINHALGLAIMRPAAWPNFSWPANRTDGGNQAADAIPEGTRLRLDPSLDVKALDLTPIATMVAEAAQTYGFIVTDTAGAVNVGAQLGQPLEDDPDFWQREMAGVPAYEVLADFPWDELEALPKDYGKPAGG